MELPMSNDIIYYVHVLDRSSKASAKLTFGWKYGTKIVDELHNEPFISPEYEDSYY